MATSGTVGKEAEMLKNAVSEEPPTQEKSVSRNTQAKRLRRPPFIPKLAQRDKVELLKSVGSSDDAIATAIGISRPTLLKHFKDELRNGPNRKKAEHLFYLAKSAQDGNVSAQKAMVSLLGLPSPSRTPGLEEFPQKWTQAGPNRRLGKKEQAQIAALTVGQGTEWGDDLIPESFRPKPS